MSGLNPNAVAFWALGACVGYLLGGDFRGVIVGLSACLAVSVVASFKR